MLFKKRFTLQISFLTLYILTFIALISAILMISSVTFLHSSSLVAKVLLKDVSLLVNKDLNQKSIAPKVLAKLTEHFLEHKQIVDAEIINYSLFVAKNTTQFKLDKPLRLVYWIDAKGNSILTYLEPDGTYSTVIMKPLAHPPIHKKYVRNSADTIIKTIEVPLVDYRKSPPYILGKKSNKFIWSDVFISPTNNLTTAATVPIDSKSGQFLGVFALDIPMEGISNFLKSLTIGKNGIVFLMNHQNQLIAAPGLQQAAGAQDNLMLLSKIGKPWAKAAVQHYINNPRPYFKFDYNNNRYIASFELLTDEQAKVTDYDQKIVVVVPESDFTSGLIKRNLMVVGTGLAILLLGILIATIFSKAITKRLKLLASDTEKIKNFQLEDVKITSAIKEVDMLASSIYSMKVNLRSFQKYMPAKLVRQLIATGEDTQLGGEKKIISILFTDIKSFTSITESMETQELITQLSEYWDNLTTIISATHGTIDKFIGDALMAFWGAPVKDKIHWEHACKAALRCSNKINELNKQWGQQGKIPFITRFGIHTGDALVGNIGSKERMNYTAIGDSVNFTSRLEQLNKIYGTSIICSEETVTLAKNKFIFRKLDKVHIRGKTGTYIIYELLGESGDELSFDFAAYQLEFDQGFNAYQHQHWLKAKKHFHQCLHLFTEDKVALLFLTRCDYLSQHSPEKDWDGVWQDIV